MGDKEEWKVGEQVAIGWDSRGTAESPKCLKTFVFNGIKMDALFHYHLTPLYQHH
jgi:hypothetical protein